MTANEIRAILFQLDMTQVHAAEMLGVTVQTVGNWTNARGDVPLSVAVLLRLMRSGAVTKKQIARASVQMPTYDPARP